MRTFSLTSLAASTAAIGLLVLGLDYATFAATGDSILVGGVNKSESKTVLDRTSAGPALRLRTASSLDAPLAVNGTGKVAHLNADQLDGKSAAQLSTRTVSFRAGHRGDEVSGQGAWRTPVKPGLYQVAFRAVLIPQIPDGGTSATTICGLVDLDTLGPRTHIYTGQTGYFGGDVPAAVSGASTIRVTAEANPGIVCVAPAGSYFLFKAITADFTSVDSRAVRTAPPVEVQGKSDLILPGH